MQSPHRGRLRSYRFCLQPGLNRVVLIQHATRCMSFAPVACLDLPTWLYSLSQSSCSRLVRLSRKTKLATFEMARLQQDTHPALDQMAQEQQLAVLQMDGLTQTLPLEWLLLQFRYWSYISRRLYRFQLGDYAVPARVSKWYTCDILLTYEHNR